MCEKPKRNEDNAEVAKDEDKPRSYYYDDAHGYEDFDPETDEIEEDEESA